MWRGFLCVVLLIGGLYASLAQTAPLREETLLQRRIRVWLKMEPMRDALRHIGKQTGVALRCQDAIAEEKIAIFVEDRPAHEILTQLASLFRYAWRKDEDGGYTLYVPDETRLQEEKMRDFTRAARQKAIQELVRAARTVSAMSEEQRKKEYKALVEKRDSLTPEQKTRLAVLFAMTPHEITVTDPEGNPINPDTLFTNPHLVLYRCLALLPDRAVSALLAGQTIGFSTKPASGIFPLPDDALLPPWMRDWTIIRTDSNEKTIFGNTQYSQRNPEFAGIWIRLATHANMVEYQLVSVQTTQYENRMPSSTTHLQRSESFSVFELESYLEESDLWRYWQAWETPLKQLQAMFPERVEPRKEPSAPQLPQYRYSDAITHLTVTTADVLEQLAWHTRRPIISDAFRSRKAFLEPIALLTPQNLLTQLHYSCWFRAEESGYLLVRHRHYWAYRPRELPEAWLRPLEQKYEQQGWLALEDYTALAGKLTETQVKYLIEDRYFRGTPLVRFEFEPLLSCLPALRFLASLNAAQRQQLDAGKWLLWRQLTPPQRRRFQEAVAERFPPAQLLFREPLPESALASESRGFQNLVHTFWTYSVWDPIEDEQPSAPDVPEEPAVRLRAMPEKRNVAVFATDGSMRVYGSMDGDSLLEVDRQEIRQMLEDDPGSRLMGVRLRGVVINFLTERGTQKKYSFVLSRFEPYTLPEPKPPQ